ncbi:conserved hypothetical protein [Histoplasma capsulatum var. duboisii H88]|uniref:Methyltransferase domain-containing protein n=1 Tax=Ajellomyces capsulatus (strain H88) TaxID=544711 RepID=F0U6S1_AJEC8|nr:conserved hypothetical protein [Histoplasma capsulatum var. duboisii H88]
MDLYEEPASYLLLRTSTERDSAWLRDLAKELPKTCRLDGFDISLEQLPDSARFPSDINYHVQDILAPFPVEFLRQLLVMGLKADEWERAIRNLGNILRPGGYLQWTDIAPFASSIVPGTPGCNVDDAKRYLEKFIEVISNYGKSGKSVTELYSHFKKCGLKDCTEDILFLDEPEYKAVLNVNYVKVISHVLQAASSEAGPGSDALPMDQIVRLERLAMKNVQETNSSFLYKLYVVTGRRCGAADQGSLIIHDAMQHQQVSARIYPI